jgi:hypothetical protein
VPGIGQHQRPLDAVQSGGLHVMDEVRPAGEAVVAGDLVLRSAQTDPAFTLASLGLLAQVLQRRTRWEIRRGEPLSARVRVLGPRSVGCSAGVLLPVGYSLPRGLGASGDAPKS